MESRLNLKDKALVVLNRTSVGPTGRLPVSRLLAVSNFAPLFYTSALKVGEERYEFNRWRGPFSKDEDSSW